jgi:hypothetical protein
MNNKADEALPVAEFLRVLKQLKQTHSKKLTIEGYSMM